MGMGFAPTSLRQVSPLLHKTTLTSGCQTFGPHLSIVRHWSRRFR